MKRLFTFILSLLIWQSATSQRNIWQYDFATDTVNLRTDTAYVMHHATVDFPSKGTAVVKMEGVVTGSKGDVITMGVSITQKWETNYGNIGIWFTDSMYNQKQFSHVMAYAVQAGSQDFYAVMHNWTKKNGTGFGSAHGRMIIEFIPDEAIGTLPLRKITKYPFVVTDSPSVFDSLTISVEEAQPYFLSAFLEIYSSSNQEIEIYMEYTDDDGDHNTIIPCPVKNTGNLRIFSTSQFAHFSPGTHKIYFKARKISGDFTSGNNAVYGTAYASPLIQNDGYMPTFYEAFSKKMDKNEPETNLQSKDFHITEDGQLYVMADGYWNGVLGDELDMELTWGTGQDETYHLTSHAIDKEENINHFTLAQIIDVKKGDTLPLALKAVFSGQPSVSGDHVVNGTLKGYLISTPIISSSHKDIDQIQSWNVFPNPVSGILTITNDVPAGQTYSMMLVSPSGEMVHQQKGPGKDVIVFDVSALASGMYMLYLTSRQATTIHKVMVLR